MAATRRARRLAAARLVLLAALLAAAVVAITLSGSLHVSSIRNRFDGLGVAGPFVFVAVTSVLTVALFPGPLMAGASGLLFGTALGTPVSIVSATLGATLAFSLSRWWAHDAVLQLARPRLLTLRDALGRRGFTAVLYARLAPGLPYALVNYAFGLTAVRLRDFVAGTALGTAPRTFAYVSLGGQFGDFSAWQTIVAITVLVAMATVGASGAFRSRRERDGEGPRREPGA